MWFRIVHVSPLQVKPTQQVVWVIARNTSAHGIEPDLELGPGHELLDAVDGEDALHELPVVVDRVHDLHRELAELVLA